MSHNFNRRNKKINKSQQKENNISCVIRCIFLPFIIIYYLFVSVLTIFCFRFYRKWKGSTFGYLTKSSIVNKKFSWSGNCPHCVGTIVVAALRRLHLLQLIARDGSAYVVQPHANSWSDLPTSVQPMHLGVAILVRPTCDSQTALTKEQLRHPKIVADTSDQNGWIHFCRFFPSQYTANTNYFLRRPMIQSHSLNTVHHSLIVSHYSLVPVNQWFSNRGRSSRSMCIRMKWESRLNMVHQLNCLALDVDLFYLDDISFFVQILLEEWYIGQAACPHDNR